MSDEDVREALHLTTVGLLPYLRSTIKHLAHGTWQGDLNTTTDLINQRIHDNRTALHMEDEDGT